MHNMQFLAGTTTKYHWKAKLISFNAISCNNIECLAFPINARYKRGGFYVGPVTKRMMNAVNRRYGTSLQARCFISILHE